ncbi:MAG: hypothetical protein ACRDJO_12270 [Actinomycetota bacterium]
MGADWNGHPGAAALLGTVVSRPFRARLEAVGGYDLRDAGQAA